MNSIRKRAGIIIIGLLAVFLGSMIATGLFTDKNSNRARPDNTPPASSPVEEPVFNYEGLLWFLTEKGDTVTQIAIEIADNEYETTRGLMFRKKMDLQQGMLFIFSDEAPRSFWMKNTYLPLDIIYADANGMIGSTQNYTTPYSEASLPSEKPAKYVVEVNAGFWDKYKLQKGYKIVFTRSNSSQTQPV